VATAVCGAASAQLGFDKSFQPGTIGPGSVSTLQLNITNTGSTPVRGLAFTDNLPAGMTVASPAAVTSTCNGILSASSGATAITLSDGSVGAYGSCTITVNVTSSTPGTHTNVTSDLSSDAGTGGPASADLTVATDRPGFSKSFSPATVFFGGRSTLTFSIDNTANTAAASSLTFIDNLPGGMIVADPNNAGITCSGGTLTATPGSSVIAYSPSYPGDASVAAGASCTISVDVIGNAVGVLGNTTGELTSVATYPARSSGKAGAELTVSYEQISLTKQFTNDPVAPGGTVDLELTVRNLDRRSTSTSIAFTDDLDAVLSGLTAVSLPAAPCGSGSVLSGTSLLSLSGGTLAAGDTCTFSVTLQVPSGAASGSYLNTTSGVTAELNGSPVSGSPATDLLVVSPVPRLTKTFIGDPVGAGGSVELRFTITNTSLTSSATAIAFDDYFIPELPTASALPANGFCGAGSTATFVPANYDPPWLMISGASLAAGASCTFSVTLDVANGATSGTYVNTTGNITAVIDGTTVTGEPASDDLVIVVAPSLFKEFTDDPVAPGDTATLRFTLSHAEDAPGDATCITFSDDLDAALSGLVATGLPLSDVCGAGSEISGTSTLLVSGGSLTPGEVCSFDVTLQVPSTAPAGAHTNTTSAVVATVLGATANGYSATDDLKIAGLTLSKEFIDDPVLPGGTVTLRYTIDNTSPVSNATNILFRDDLDNVVDNLAATGLPLADLCGTGSTLTGVGGNTLLIFDGGTLAAGEQCTFDVTLQVPAATEADTYTSLTSFFSATIDGSTVFFDNAYDVLTVASNFLTLSKEFTDDPAAPGGMVNLQFTITNLHDTETISDIAFSDDLDPALPGVVSTSGTLADLCGIGSQISGSDLLSFSGGSLAAGAGCTFDVTLAVPSLVSLGTVATNTTSEVTGTIGGLGVSGDPASDDLRIDYMTFSKSFGGEVSAGGIVPLTFSIQNLSDDTVSFLSFTDDLAGIYADMAAIRLPEYDVCGEGSMLAGTGYVVLANGSLAPTGSCTFTIDVQIPDSIPPGNYLNVTSDLMQFGSPVAAAASDTLVVIADTDADDDGVLDGDDFCPGTMIPEGVPTVRLGVNRYALVDDDLVFDTTPPNDGSSVEVFTTTDTAGCSCEQIIVALGLGQGHVKFGCSLGAMRDWVTLVSQSSRAVFEDEWGQSAP
jgi:uncharacterized repeat protein (TIGR01451 family)